jgi:GDP-L-fucose synthase
MISILSTCIYPDIEDRQYPLVEEDLHKGPPTKTNFTYGYAKRCLKVHMDAYNEKKDTCYSAVTPCNLYSEHDHFEGDKAHFVSALLKKINDCEQEKSIAINLLGDGTPLRQFMYADDLAKAIVLLMDKNTPFHFNLCNNENLTIKEIAQTAMRSLNLELPILWSSHGPKGQYRKDASSASFLKNYPDFKFTNLIDGIEKTYRKKFN